MTSSQAYVGTTQRTFSNAVIHLMETGYHILGSDRVLELMAHDLTALAEQFYPQPERLKSGWMVFTGVKAEGPKAHPGQSAADHKLVTLAWPVLLPEDVQEMSKRPIGKPGQKARRDLLQKRITRLVEYGEQHAQGPVLLTLADLAAMLNSTTVQVSQLLKKARQETGKPLLTKGLFFDQGMRPTHKDQIIALYESGMDEADIARQSQNQQTSVGKYIRDYERVKNLLKIEKEPQRIVYLTGMQPNVVKAYIDMVYLYHPDLAPEQGTPAQT